MNYCRIAVFAAVALCAANVLATPQLPFKRGTNCRGLDESAYSTSTWGKTYIYGLDSTYTDIKAKGFDFVRFSVDLTKYYDSNNDCLYTSGSYNITNIDTFLQKFINAGLSPHLLMGRFQGGSMDSANAAHQAKFKRVWQLVADRYKDWPDSLVFELINEPPESTDEAVAVLNTLFAETVAVIRQTNPTRLILWPVANSGAAGSIEKKGWVELPEDHSNIAIVVHSYAPGAFTHQGASWCTDANGNPMNYHVDLTDAHRLETRWDFGSVRQYAEAHPDIPLVLNEFGVMSGLSTPSEAYEWLFAMREFCEAGNISWAHFEYTDYNNYQGFATRSAPTGDTWRTNALEALFPKGWDDQPLTYGQLDLESFSKRMNVSFTGYAGAETLTDFPVLVKLSSDIPRFSYSDFQLADGGDLRFADSSGKHIPHEIDTWNPNGVSTVWVKVPQLTASTTILACYGCANPPPVQGKDVWNDDYVGVWHLGGASLPLRESSRKSVSFTQRNGRGLTFASPGVVGGSVAFDGGMSNSLIAVDHDAFDKYSKYTFEVWTKQSEHKQNAGILCKSRDYDVWRAYLMTDGGSATRLSLSKYGNAITDATDLFDAPVDGSWRHQVCSLDTTSTSGNVKGYLNGELAGTQSVKTNKFYTGAGYLVLGNTQPIGRNTSFNGSIDEVRISKCIRSADWIKATHDTVAKADFATYSFGDVPPPEPERILYVNVAAGATNNLNAALVTEYITNIVKQGAGTLVASAIPDYTHLITVEGGIWRGGANAGDFGASGATIDVKDGASLYLTGSNPSNLVANALSGKTVNLYGSKATSANAKIMFYNKNARNLGTNVSINLKDSDEMFFIASGGSHVNMTSGTIDLGGHELRLKATGVGVRYEIGATFKNGGSLVYDKCLLFAETYVPTLAQAGASGATLRLENAALNLKKAMNSNGWNIVCSNSYMTGNTVRFPANTGVPKWDGGVQFLKASSIANYGGGYNVSNTVFNLKGAVSGSGTLKVGPGWLNLHNANNTYSGSVTVNGQNPTSGNPILPGGGGIGVWLGAAVFPQASSVALTNSARIAFMDDVPAALPKLTFDGAADQSVTGGGCTNEVRSTLAGLEKNGTGTLTVASPVRMTAPAVVKGGTLKISTSDPRDGRKLVWSDDFSGSSLDSSKWTTEAAMRSSGTQITYNNNSPYKKVENGTLHFKVGKSGSKYVTTDSVVTKNLMAFKYGYLEMRAKVPYSHGAWPSLWMKAHPELEQASWMSEVDIFEVFPSRDGITPVPNIHKWTWAGSGSGAYATFPHEQIATYRKSINYHYDFPSTEGLSDEYHVYGFEWTADEMSFYVDGCRYASFNLNDDFYNKSGLAGMDGFRTFHYILLNNELMTRDHDADSTWINDSDLITSSDPLPEYTVDWIRLWQKDGEETRTKSGGSWTTVSAVGSANVASRPAVDEMEFYAGTRLDLAGTPSYSVARLKGSPAVTNAVSFAVTERWTLTSPGEVLGVSGGFGFMEGAAFDLADEAAFAAAAAAAGDNGILVAYAHMIITNGFVDVATPLPQPAANISPRWQMYVTGEGHELRLRLAPASGYTAWVAEKGIDGAPGDKYNGIERGLRYAFDIDPASATVGDPIIKVVRDAVGNPVVEARELAEGRDDVTFGILATENLTDWSNATLVPMKKFATDGYWRPTASESSAYVYPAKMFFKYTIDID